MATKKKLKKPSGETITLTVDPPEGKALLRVKNTTRRAFTLGADVEGLASVYLRAQTEVVLPAKWGHSRLLRKVLATGELVADWVDENYEAEPLATLDDAPEELTLDLNPYERQFALQIATAPLDEAISLVATKPLKVGGENGRPDLAYTKDKFRPILTLAAWLEERRQNRSEVLEAIEARRDSIRVM